MKIERERASPFAQLGVTKTMCIACKTNEQSEVSANFPRETAKMLHSVRVKK